MSTISSLELGINLNTSTNLKKTFDHTELSITPPYVTKKFSSLTSKQSSFKTTKRNDLKSKETTKPPKKTDSGKSFEKTKQQLTSSASKNERNASINDKKARKSTSRSRNIDFYHSPPQSKLTKTVSKHSFHLKLLKSDSSNVDISQNMTPSILNTSQVLMTSPLNLSLVFSKQNNINNGISPVSPWKSSNNLGKEHARNKTQTSSNNAEESKTERDGSFQQRKRKTMLKNNSSSNIFEKSCMRKKMGSKDQSVNVKKINLISRQEDNHDSSLHEFEKILKLKKQSSNRSENFTEYKEDFETSIAYQKTHHYLKKREKIRIFEEKKFRKERKRLRQDLKQQQNQKKHLLLLNKKIEDNKETIARGIKNLMKENLSIKIALDFLQISDSKLSINFDFLLKTPGIIIPTTDFRVFYDRVLGNGGFGTVYEGQFANKRVAIKVMDVPLDYLKMLLKEIITMVMCDHTNLVKLFAVSFGNAENNNVKVFILMECLKQDLKNLIFRERAHLPPKLKYKILISILKGLNFLHESHYVHCDLKLQNILVDEHFNAKISDFGLANCLRFGNTKNTMIAGYSERTSAYEYLCEQKISTKGDIWSFGIMMYELLMEKISWEKFSGVQVVAKVSLKTPFFDCNQRTGSKFEEEIIEECLNYNHNKRPSAKELINKLEMFVGRLKS